MDNSCLEAHSVLNLHVLFDIHLPSFDGMWQLPLDFIKNPLVCPHRLSQHSPVIPLRTDPCGNSEAVAVASAFPTNH